MSKIKGKENCIVKPLIVFDDTIVSNGGAKSSNVKSSVAVRLALAINNDNKYQVGELLRNFDPNGLIRNKPVIAYVRSGEMLDFLVARGLDLSLNRPLVHCKRGVFRELVSRLDRVDIFSEYEHVGGWKKKEIAKSLVERRRELFFILSGTSLASDMSAVVIDMVCPCPDAITLRDSQTSDNLI